MYAMHSSSSAAARPSPTLGCGWVEYLKMLPPGFQFTWETLPEEIVLLSLERVGIVGTSLEDAKRTYREVQRRGDQQCVALLKAFNGVMDDFTASRREFAHGERFAYVYLYFREDGATHD